MDFQTVWAREFPPAIFAGYHHPIMRCQLHHFCMILNSYLQRFLRRDENNLYLRFEELVCLGIVLIQSLRCLISRLRRWCSLLRRQFRLFYCTLWLSRVMGACRCPNTFLRHCGMCICRDFSKNSLTRVNISVFEEMNWISFLESKCYDIFFSLLAKFTNVILMWT